MSYNPSGKIKRVSGGQLLSPGTCFSCGNASRPVYADIGQTEWDGALYLCEVCTLSAATIFGNMVPADEKILRNEISTLEKELNKKDKRIRELEKVNESFRLVFRAAGLNNAGNDGTAGSASPVPNDNGRAALQQSSGSNGSNDRSNERTNSSKRPEPDRSITGDEEDLERILDSTTVDDSGPNETDAGSTRTSDKSSDSERRSYSSELRLPTDVYDVPGTI